MVSQALSTVFADLPSNPGQVAYSFVLAGVPVFPCVPTQKVPFKWSRGLLDATTNLDVVAQWWRRYPNANLAVPTGTISGVVVVDVDVHAVNGYAAFRRARQHGLIPAPLAVVRTPTGGMHLYYPAASGGSQRSWQAAKAGIDFRGDGGYVIVPPSRLRVQWALRSYEVHMLRTDDVEPVDALRLREFLRPPRPIRARTGAIGPARPSDVTRISAFVGTLVEGERNSGLFWAACRLVERGLSPDEALGALGPPAEAIGLPGWEIETTVLSAYRNTTASPTRTTSTPDPFTRPESPRASPAGRGL